MSNKKKEFFLVRWFKRCFLGDRPELSDEEEERIQTPVRAMVANFVHRPLAMIGLIVFLAIFVFVMVGPHIWVLDLSEQDSTLTNLPPSRNMMEVPKALLANGVKDISSGNTYGIGIDNEGELYTWGHTRITDKIDVADIPDEVRSADLVQIAAGTDHVVAVDADGEVYVYGHRMTYTAPQFTVGDTTWRVKSLLDRCTVNGAAAADVTPSLYVVVPDFESAARLLLDLSADSDLSVQLRWYYQFDSDLPDDAQHGGSASYGTDGVPASLTDALQLALYNVNAETDLTTGWEVESLAANRSDFYGAYGGLFYLGIMLSAVFSLAAVSIIYYKQVCEGYEDQSRFAIMQKVGMTKQDIRRSINSQLLTVFFLPMALSGVHLCFAFPFIHKLLLLFNLSNTSLLIGTTVVCYVAFALLYTLAYKLTSNAYYHIVSGAAERE